jgi:hypothetical protein
MAPRAEHPRASAADGSRGVGAGGSRWLMCPCASAGGHASDGPRPSGRSALRRSGVLLALGFLALALHAGLLVVLATASLGEDARLLDLLVEAAQGALERLVLAYSDFCQLRIHLLGLFVSCPRSGLENPTSRCVPGAGSSQERRAARQSRRSVAGGSCSVKRPQRAASVARAWRRERARSKASVATRARRASSAQSKRDARVRRKASATREFGAPPGSLYSPLAAAGGPIVRNSRPDRVMNDQGRVAGRIATGRDACSRYLPCRGSYRRSWPVRGRRTRRRPDALSITPSRREIWRNRRPAQGPEGFRNHRRAATERSG